MPDISDEQEDLEVGGYLDEAEKDSRAAAAPTAVTAAAPMAGGATQTTLTDWLCDAMREITLDAIRQGFRESKDSERSEMSVTLSKLSGTELSPLLARLGLPPLIHGRQFPSLPRQQHQIPPFNWPRHGASENEVNGYPAALEWLQEHVCPQGVTALLKHTASWLELQVPEKKVHIRAGATDVLFVLEEDRAVAETAADVRMCILSVVGMAELKTCRAFEEKRAAAVAQTVAGHMCASLIQGGTMEAVSQQNGFVALVSDLNKGWAIIKRSPEGLCIYEATPPGCQEHFQAYAAHAAQQWLHEAAASLRAFRGHSTGTTPQPPRGAAPDSLPPVSSSAGPPSSPGGNSAASGGGGSSEAAQGGSNPSGTSGGRSTRASTATLSGAQKQELVAGFLRDDDKMRELDAAHSYAIVSLMRTPLGYAGLLGLPEAPRSIQHTPLSDTFSNSE